MPETKDEALTPEQREEGFRRLTRLANELRKLAAVQKTDMRKRRKTIDVSPNDTPEPRA
jgi:hypothetical protein